MIDGPIRLRIAVTKRGDVADVRGPSGRRCHDGHHSL